MTRISCLNAYRSRPRAIFIMMIHNLILTLDAGANATAVDARVAAIRSFILDIIFCI